MILIIPQIHALVHPFVQDKVFSDCPGCCTRVSDPTQMVSPLSGTMIFFCLKKKKIVSLFLKIKKTQKAMRLLNFKY